MRFFDRLYQKLQSKVKIFIQEDAELHEYCTHRGYHVCYVVRRSNFVLRWILRAACESQSLPIVTKKYGQNFSQSGSDADLIALRPRSILFLSQNDARDYREDLASKLNLCPIKTVLVPVSLLVGKGPSPLPAFIETLSIFPFGELWTLAIIFFYRNELELEFGKIVPLTEAVREDLNKVTRELYRSEKQRRGAILQAGETVERVVLSGSEYENLLAEISESELLSYLEVSDRARRLLNGIMGGFSRAAIRIFKHFLEPSVKRLFEGVDIEGLESAREAIRNHPVILLPNHRSHFDYLLISYVLYREGLPLPYIAAGDNLNFFPMGALFRRAGAFFIRRRSQRDPLYKFVLERYIRYLLKQGHLIEFFIEGGRSRSALPLNPKFGLLKYVVQAAAERKDALAMPVGITYERIPEEESLCREMQGENKRSENLIGTFKAISILRSRFGTVSVRFGNATTIRELESNDVSAAAVDFGQEQVALTEVTPFALYATALALHPNAKSEQEIINGVSNVVLDLLRLHGVSGIAGEDVWEQIERPDELGISLKTAWCFAGRSIIDGAGALTYYIKRRDLEFPKSPAVREYYKNQMLSLILGRLVGALENSVGKDALQLSEHVISTLARYRKISASSAPTILLNLLSPPLTSAMIALEQILSGEEDLYKDDFFQLFKEKEAGKDLCFSHYAELAATLAKDWRNQNPTDLKAKAELLTGILGDSLGPKEELIG